MTLEDFNSSVNEARQHLRESDVPIYRKSLSDYVLEFLFCGGLFAGFYIIYIFLSIISS